MEDPDSREERDTLESRELPETRDPTVVPDSLESKEHPEVLELLEEARRLDLVLLESRDRMERLDLKDPLDTPEPLELLDSLDPREHPDSLESLEPMDSLDSLDNLDSPDVKERRESVPSTALSMEESSSRMALVVKGLGLGSADLMVSLRFLGFSLRFSVLIVSHHSLTSLLLSQFLGFLCFHKTKKSCAEDLLNKVCFQWSWF